MNAIDEGLVDMGNTFEDKKFSENRKKFDSI